MSDRILPPAGWFDDGSGRQRWWNGTAWTDHYQGDAGPEPETSPDATRRGLTARLFAPISDRASAVVDGVREARDAKAEKKRLDAERAVELARLEAERARLAAEAAAEKARLAAQKRRAAQLRTAWIGGGAILGATVILAAVALVSIASPSTRNASARSAPATTSTAHASQHPTVTPTPVGTPMTAANPAASQSALNVLATLEIAAPSSSEPYDRVKDFGTSWLDMDHNGCDTRDDILARDLTSVIKKGSCIVESGTLADPYTGTTISFVRGVQTSSKVQIDHVVPLGDAWVTGASLLSLQQRESLANDPLNLLAVDGPTNEAKNDKDAAAWLPPNAAYDCQYVARQVAVKATYGLWVTQAEHDKMQSVLTSCPSQAMPTSSFASGPVVTAPTPTPTPTVAPVVPAPVPDTSGSSSSGSSGSSSGSSGSSGMVSNSNVVHPGAYCSPVGATGVTSAGTAMICGPTANSTRARWHAAG